MTDVANLTLELLRTYRAESKEQLDQLRREIRNLAEEARIVNAHIVGVVRHENLNDSRLAELQIRIERLERAMAVNQVELPSE